MAAIISATPKEIVTRVIEEALNRGDLRAVDEFVGADALDHEELPVRTGSVRGDLKTWFARLRGAFPDYHSTIEDLVAEGDRVVVRQTVTGTHRGAFMGIEPTGRRVRFEAIDIFRVRDGRIVEHWGLSDSAALAAQLGVGG